MNTQTITREKYMQAPEEYIFKKYQGKRKAQPVVLILSSWDLPDSDYPGVAYFDSAHFGYGICQTGAQFDGREIVINLGINYLTVSDAEALINKIDETVEKILKSFKKRGRWSDNLIEKLEKIIKDFSFTGYSNEDFENWPQEVYDYYFDITRCKYCDRVIDGEPLNSEENDSHPGCSECNPQDDDEV